MPTLPNGEFSVTIPAQDLGRGLRPSKRAPRNSKFLVECVGAVGMDGVLQALEDVSSIVDITVMGTPVFPYPQLFVFTNMIVIADEVKIYEIISGTLTEVLDVTGSKGIIWSAIDSGDYVYMTNGVVAITRSATSGVWAIDSSVPFGSALCNYNGQLFVGSPNVDRS